jgi:hypothetical protein
MIEYIGYREENLRRIARRLGLCFHIDCWLYGTNKLLGHGMLTEHAGHKSETREATEPELQMWLQLIPDDFNPEELPANHKELEDSFQYRKGPFTISTTDFHTALQPNFDLFDLEDKPIYVSKHIPVGFFYEGHNPELHNQSEPLPDELIAKVGIALQPFVCGV